MRVRLFTFCMLGLVGLAQLGLGAGSARASLLLNFAQTSNNNTIVGTKTGDTGFTIAGTDIPILITQIDPSTGLSGSINAYLTVNVASTAAAVSAVGVDVQAFSGLITVTSGTGGTGTNYLSTTTLSAGAAGQDGSQTLVLGSTNGGVAFTSDVFPTMLAPQSISLQLAHVLPSVGVSGNSLADFTASVTGTASASLAIPEPSSIVAAMIGLAIVAPIGRRRLARKS